MRSTDFPGSALTDIEKAALRLELNNSPIVKVQQKAASAAQALLSGTPPNQLPGQEPLEKPFPVYIRPEWRALAHLRVREFKNWRECAIELGVSYQTILLWKGKVLYQQYEAHLQGAYLESVTPAVRKKREQVREDIEDSASEMFDRLKVIVETTSDQKLAASICQDLLDRAGVATVQERKVSHTIQLSDDKLEALFARANEIGMPIIDVTPASSPVTALSGEQNSREDTRALLESGSERSGS